MWVLWLLVWVKEVRLVDFRSYEQVEVSLAPGVTTFVGANGQGKTNLVEAIGYASVLSSHRVATDAPLVRIGADRAVIGVDVVTDDRSTLLELELNPGRANRARLNHSPVPGRASWSVWCGPSCSHQRTLRWSRGTPPIAADSSMTFSSSALPECRESKWTSTEFSSSATHF